MTKSKRGKYARNQQGDTVAGRDHRPKRPRGHRALLKLKLWLAKREESLLQRKPSEDELRKQRNKRKGKAK